MLTTDARADSARSDLIFEPDDGGSPRHDAAARWLLANDPTHADSATDDLMAGGRRSALRLADAGREASFIDHASRQRVDGVQLCDLESDLDAKLTREREYLARRQWIENLCKPVTTQTERLKRVRHTLLQLGKARSDDYRAILAYVAHADMLGIPAISAKHRINLIAYVIKDGGAREFGRCPRTAYAYVKRGQALVSDLARHVLPELSHSPADVNAAYVKARRAGRAGKRLTKAEIEAKVASSLHDTSVSFAAISKLSPRDQAIMADAIEQHVIFVEMEASEAVDHKAGLRPLSCEQLENLDFADRLSVPVFRQLARRSKAEQNFIVREFVTDKLDALTGRTASNADKVRDLAVAYQRFARGQRASLGRQIKGIIGRSRRESGL